MVSEKQGPRPAPSLAPQVETTEIPLGDKVCPMFGAETVVTGQSPITGKVDLAKSYGQCVLGQCNFYHAPTQKCLIHEGLLKFVGLA